VTSSSTAPRRRRRASTPPLSAALLVSALTLAACGAAPPPRPVAPPLAAGTTAAGAAWAVAPMGDLSHSVTTFWQLFGRVASRWVLATPPGIATNGGVVAATGPSGAVTAGVLPSGNLRFSAVQATADLGRVWSIGVLPAGLVRSPDALASSARGRRLALLAIGGETVAQSPDALSSWRAVASLGRVAEATAPHGCRFVALSAVGFAPDGAVLVAGRCASGDELPIAERDAGTWRLVDPEARIGVDASVLRLVGSPVGVASIVEVGGAGHRAVRTALGRGDLSAWTATSPLVVPRGWSLLSTTLDATGESVVVLARGDGTRTAYVSDPSSARWRALPRLPRGTVDVVAGAGGADQALVVRGATLLVYASSSHASWRLRERLVVPISIGSSR
jgi:hypothetical protein